MAPATSYLTNTTWLNLLRKIIVDGENFHVRGRNCREVRGLQTRIPLSAPVVTINERKLGYKFMPGEAAWILSGSNRVCEIAEFSKRMLDYSDDGVTLFGAYGPKVVDQIPYVVETLRRDLWSRQAVINIWRERPPVSKDIPCTLSLQFLVRNGKLHTVVSMRSSDAWLGWPYDVFSFSMVTAYLALAIRDEKIATLQLGDLTLTAGSAHLYEDNLSDAMKLINQQTSWDYRPMSIYQFICPGDLLEHLTLLSHAQFEDLKYPFLHELSSRAKPNNAHETTKADHNPGGGPQV